MQMDTTTQSCEVCRDTAEYKSAWTSHNQQRQTYLHGATSELNAALNGSTALRYFNSSTTRTNKSSCRKLFEETDSTAKRSVNRR